MPQCGEGGKRGANLTPIAWASKKPLRSDLATLDLFWPQAKNLKSYHELLQYIDNLPNLKSKERLKHSVEEILGEHESVCPSTNEILDVGTFPLRKTLVGVIPMKRAETHPFHFDENKQEWITQSGCAISSHELRTHGLI